jgi:hypothetical protein
MFVMGFAVRQTRDSTQGTFTGKLQMNASEVTSGSIVGVATLMSRNTVSVSSRRFIVIEILCRLKLSIRYHALQ